MTIPVMEINKILMDWAAITPPIEDFTVEHILHKAKLDITYYDEVFKFLMRMRDYLVVPQKVLLCPNNHKCHTFSFEDPIDTEEIYDCWCGEEDFEPDNIIIVFNFTESFKEEALKKKNMTNRQILQLV